MTIIIASSSSSAWYSLPQLFISCPLTASANVFEEKSIFSNRADSGVSNPHRKSPPGIPCDSTKFVFQFARAITNHFLRKKLRVELWWVLLLVDIFRRQNLEVNKCDRFCPGNFIVWSLDMSGEFPWQLDYTPCCETIYKDMVLFLPFLFHHFSLRNVTETRDLWSTKSFLWLLNLILWKLVRFLIKERLWPTCR